MSKIEHLSKVPSRSPRDGGFTLIELIVVIALISIVLVFTIPRFRHNLLSDPSRLASQWILVTVPDLKERAVRERKDFILHVDIDANRMWITNEEMTEDDAEAALSEGLVLPEDLYLKDIEFPGGEMLTSGQAEIHFHKKGYSDKVLIHTEEGDDQRSYLIESFLQRVKLYDRYVSFGS